MAEEARFEVNICFIIRNIRYLFTRNLHYRQVKYNLNILHGKAMSCTPIYVLCMYIVLMYTY